MAKVVMLLVYVCVCVCVCVCMCVSANTSLSCNAVICYDSSFSWVPNLRCYFPCDLSHLSLVGLPMACQVVSVPISFPALRFTILHYRSDSIVPGVRCSTPYPFRGIVVLVCERYFRISALRSILIQVM
jgi:hypothetical protein